MENYYFTFGSSELFPYRYGYVIVKADDYWHAREIFGKYHPNRENGFMNFAFQYTQKEWDKVEERFKGICHEVMTEDEVEYMEN